MPCVQQAEPQIW